ncbi:hypothetical protein [Cryptosporangium sp. NPDC051539]|uniref:hypothetical protein n=1 Tax=Cryptosporangium sp. NPDC051539 TaxID=3363962 RepID=UPI00378C2526
MSSLPPVEAIVLADAVDALPGRLRKRLDAAVEKVAAWAVTVDGAVWTLRVDDDTLVTLTAADGAVRSAEAARCTCLLAPHCLHRTAALAAAPTAGAAPASSSPQAGPTESGPTEAALPGADRTETGAPGADPTARGGGVEGPDGGLTSAQRGAVEGLWLAAGAVLCAGVAGSGAATRAALLRAAHDARAHGAHAPAAAARQVAAHLHDARTSAPHYRLATLTDDLRELLLLAHRLRTRPSAFLLGTARRAYQPRGSLRLYGLCTIPVLTRAGSAGTTTYAADRDGTLWLIADLRPGDVHRALTTAGTGIPIGAGTLSHRDLARAGLTVTGATASESRQLGAGQDVRAVRASGVTWDEPPLAALWDEPLDAQLDRAFAALAVPVPDRGAGSDLLFLNAEILGPSTHGVSAVTDDGRLVTLAVAIDHEELPYRDNLRVLGAATGVRIRVIGRPDPARPRLIQALAVNAEGVRLPPAWAGHADLGYDRLHRSMITAPQAGPTAYELPRPDPALGLLRRHLDRTVDGGRAIQAFAADRRRGDLPDTGTALLASLTAAARPGERNAFGRLVDDDGERFVLAWLAAAVYEQAAAQALTRAAWSAPA